MSVATGDWYGNVQDRLPTVPAHSRCPLCSGWHVAVWPE